MKIMLVEDDATIREMIGETLAKWGFEIAMAVNFEQILQTFLNEQPHLVIMDINLPLYDGFYWCGRIREVSKVPIIFLSSRHTPMDMIMSMNNGGDDYMQKPFHSDVLVAKINALLRRAYAYSDIQTRVLAHDGLLLNVEDGTILCGEQKMQLSKTEFLIFQILMRHKGSIVSRKKIMRSLWEDESFVDDNTLTVNMTRLRKKLDELGKADFIATRKGQGYIIL